MIVIAKVKVVSAFEDSDKLCKSLLKVKNNVKSLTKDIEEYRRISNKAFSKKIEVQLDITKAKAQLNELEKAYIDGDKNAEQAFKNKQKYLDLLNEKYRRLSDAIADASEQEKHLADDLKVSGNNSSLPSGGKKSNGTLKSKGTLKSIATSELGGMVADSVGGFAKQSISSAFGSSTGDAVGNVVGGAAKGAAMGTAVLGPGIGTAIGGAIGALTGAIDSLTNQLEKKDEVFREQVKNIGAIVKQQQEQNQQNGMETFLAREQSKLGFSEQDISDIVSGVKSFDDDGATLGKVMETYSGKLAKVNDLKADINSGYGEGYTETRQKGLDAEIEKLSGETGENMKFLQDTEGKYDAQLENSEAEIKMKTYEDLFNNEDFKKYKNIVENAENYSDEEVEEAIAEVHKFKQEADVQAQTNWETSDENQADIKQEMELTESIQKALAASEEYIELLVEKADKESLGILGGKRLLKEEKLEEVEKARDEYLDKLEAYWKDQSIWDRMFSAPPTPEELEKYQANKGTPTGNGNATGLHRVPFDNMPTLLHEGERVLTRLQADNLDRMSNAPTPNINLQVTANTSDPYQLARILYSELKNAMENYNGGV